MKKPRENKPKRRRARRRARIKKRKGPTQLWLPLQMPLALGAVKFVEAPTNGHAALDADRGDDSGDSDADRALSAANTKRQAALF